MPPPPQPECEDVGGRDLEPAASEEAAANHDDDAEGSPDLTGTVTLANREAIQYIETFFIPELVPVPTGYILSQVYLKFLDMSKLVVPQ